MLSMITLHKKITSASATPATFPETPQSSSQRKRITNEEKASIDKKYKEEKIDIMKKEFENRKTYYEQKTVLLQQIAEELHLIRVGLNQK